jgi:hypothetical protein
MVAPLEPRMSDEERLDRYMGECTHPYHNPHMDTIIRWEEANGKSLSPETLTQAQMVAKKAKKFKRMMIHTSNDRDRLLYDGGEFNWHYDCKVLDALGAEYKARLLPENRVYTSVPKRKWGSKDAEAIGQIVIDAQERYGNRLTSEPTNEWKAKITEYIRSSYTEIDHASNKPANELLRAEISARWVAAYDEICTKVEDMMLGLDKNPIRTMRELRSKTW